MSTTNFEYENAHILVTGSSRGLGLAFVRELNRRKAGMIYAACRSQKGCAEIAELELENVTPILLDVTNSEQVSTLNRTVGQLDLLINNAGIASACTYSSAEAIQTARAEIDVHYFGSLSMVQTLLPALKDSKSAGIINISSIAGLTNFKAMGTYSASKSALHFLTQGLRAELVEDNIFVQGVYPGPFDTRLAAGYSGEKPSPSEIATIILDAFLNREEDVFPDEFSRSMYATYVDSPKELEKVFSAN